MPFPSVDIIVRRIDLRELPNLFSRITDLKPDPRGGGYFALAAVDGSVFGASPGYVLLFDDAHNLRQAWAFSLQHEGEPGHTIVHAAAMDVGPAGIFIAGTIIVQRGPLPNYVFVAKFSLDGRREGVRVYVPNLVDGCRYPYAFHSTGRGIGRLPAPDDDKLMVLFQTTVLSNGFTDPPADDSAGAGVFLIGDDLSEKSLVTRLFCRGHFVATRLRVLPKHGPTIVGKTRRLPGAERWQPAWMRIDLDGNPVEQLAYDLGTDAVLNDVVAHGDDMLAVGELEPPDSSRSALAMRMAADGSSTRWIAEYVKHPQLEHLTLGLTTLAAFDDQFIAGGWQNPGGNSGPWLVRLDPSAPPPVWHKWYRPLASSALNNTCSALLLNQPNRVIGGGSTSRNTVHEQKPVIHREPLLFVSETEPGIESPVCSDVLPIDVQIPDARPRPGTLWLDRMRIFPREWIQTSEMVEPEVRTICPDPTPP